MKNTTKKTKKERAAEPPFPLVTSKSSQNYRDAFAAVAKLLEGRKNVLVLAGAGSSVSCGIPDFRSRGSGLYSMLSTEELGLSHPEDLFDYEFFLEDPTPFYKFSKALYFPKGEGKRVEPSDSHRFLALLQKRGMLLRVYTQNIDGLEQVAGVSPKKMVYAHGSLQWATCCKCKHKVSAADIEDSILKGIVPRCRQPKADEPQPSLRPESSRRKRARAQPTTPERTCCNGVLKPGVTFFGESLHGNVNRSLEADRDKADALIVIGTSLSVAPMSHVIDYLPPNIPRILINRNIVHPPMTSLEDSDEDQQEEDFRNGYVFDAHLLGFSDDCTRALVKEMTGTANEQEEGKLLSCLDPNDELYCAQEWDSLTLPKDRVFLFPGASRGDDLSEYSYREIAHCDGCSEQIKGTVYKCVQCFDYDLCETCYPKLSKKHHNGTHTFSTEVAAKTP